MTQAIAEELKADVVGGHWFVFAPAGQGEALRLHLAAHGITNVVVRSPGVSFDRLELRGELDAQGAQAILGQWEPAAC